MTELYHCLYKKPQGDSLLATCFREVNGETKNYLYAATHLTKALAFAFSYHDNEVVFNANYEHPENEIVVLCGGQDTINKPRHIRVYGFPDDGFTEIPHGRQAVSENPMPFSRTRLVLETTDIDDLMKRGLQIFVLPKKLDAYFAPEDENRYSQKHWEDGNRWGQLMAKIIEHDGAVWLNRERGINPCPLLSQDIPDTPARAKRANPSFDPS